MTRLALSTGRRNIARRIKGDAALASASNEEADSGGSDQQQRHVERTETAAPHCHGEGIRCERQGKQQRAHLVDTSAIRLRPPTVNGQEATREEKGQDPQRNVDEEEGPPAESGDQDAAERRTESRAERGHCSQEPHGASGLCLRNDLTHKSHAERHHDGRSEPLRSARGNQQPERGRKTAQD